MTVSMSTIRSELRTAVLSAGSNTNVIYFYPNGPRPEMPYTSIQHLSISGELNDWDIFDKVNDLNRMYGYRDIVFTINTYGAGAHSEAMMIQGNIRKQTIRDVLRETVQCSIIELSTITDLTSLVDSDFEERATFDLTLSVLVEDGSSTDDTGYFDTFETPEWTNKP